MQIALVSAQRDAIRARLTVRHARTAVPDATVHVVDVDGTYRPVSGETVHPVESLGIPTTELHRRAVVHGPDGLARSLLPLLVPRIAVPPGHVVALLSPGVLLLRPPALPDGPRLALVSRTAGALPDDGRHPDADDLVRTGAFAPLVLLRDPVAAALDTLTAAAGSDGPRWLDRVAEAELHSLIDDPAYLVSAASLQREHRIKGAGTVDAPLTLDGRPVTALDLSGLDPDRPWLLDADGTGDPRGRLSEHPALAAVVRSLAEQMTADAGPTPRGAPAFETTSLGTPVDAPLRALYRHVAAEHFGTDVPDPYDPDRSADLLAFLTEPPADGGPSRYLRMVHATRPDLQAAFPSVPGADDLAFLAWARTHAVADGYPATLVSTAVRRRVGRRPPSRRPRGEPVPAPTPGPPSPTRVPPAPRPRARRPHGVNVVGFLRGELGIGESARLLVGALHAAGIPFRTVPVDQHLASRQGVDVTDTGGSTVFDTTVICVNADLTPAISRSVPELVDRSYRIGMWYWEVEDFPPTQHGGFDLVDEVWVATDFVRRAVEPHSPVPVRIVTPPLPQRGAEPTLTRTDLGLPDRPLFLFSFDFLSTAERKNPWGLIDAFRQAFAPDEGPVLVIKSINADRRPAEAERLRLHAAGHPDVLLLEEYLEAAGRDALVALCDVYVSLHRSEGLGLTMAEAMAWGKPVIATGYSGNLQFMTEENSFLVPWVPVAIPPDAEPYPAGGTWADPDLPAAAAAMRLVMERPDVAAARGARAAADIATLHSPAAAGREAARRLAELTGHRGRTPSRVAFAAHRLARRVRRGLG